MKPQIRIFKFSCIFVATILSVASLTLPSSTKGGEANINTHFCSPAELTAKECFLQQGSLRLQFRPETIVINDGTWRGLVDMPIKGKRVEWVSVRFREMMGRQLVEMLLWTEPEGEASLQNLTWVVGEIKAAKLEFALSEVVSKRRYVEPGSKARRISSLKDQLDHFGLKTMDDQGHIHWWAGRRSGKF